MSVHWYSVKCLFHHPTRRALDERYLYEERITLWKANSIEEAHAKAEAEARRYAAEAACHFVDSTDSFLLEGESLDSGSEVYSIMRGSNFDPDQYQRTFCITDLERAKPLGE